MDDESVLIGTIEPPRRSFRGCICPLLLAVGVISLTTAVLISFFQDTYDVGIVDVIQDGVPVRILALNTWGMPEVFGSQDKEKRMPAIGKLVANQDYDVYLFEELWLRKDHDVIKNHLPKGYHMTSYDAMAQTPCPDDPLTPFLCCDGSATPSGCSGLAVVSRFPIEKVQFTIYNDHGPMAGGEKLARKGFGRVHVKPAQNLTMDIFVTHTCASDTVLDKKARENQVSQLLKAVRASKADFQLLGGDFNSDPRATKENTYSQLKKDMSSSMEEFFKIITAWLIPKRATYGNPRNTYSNMYDPVLYDYIWHRTKPGNLIMTNLFDIPFLTTDMILTTEAVELKTNKLGNLTHKSAKFKEGKSLKTKVISLSDHEAVSASLLLYKKVGAQQDAGEFLFYMLNGMHEECKWNVVPAEPSAPTGEEAGRNRKVEYRSTGVHEDSPILRVFGGLLRSSVRSRHAKADSVSLELFNHLILDISSPGVDSVWNALEAYCGAEAVNEGRATKRLQFKLLPKVLIVSLKRFSYDKDSDCPQKIKKAVRYEEKLVFDPAWLADDVEPQEYQLTSVICHHGESANGGHYNAAVRYNAEWYMYDDSLVRQMEAREVMNQQLTAYLLVYQSYDKVDFRP